MGIPCAVVSRTHFRGKGFTIDVDSRKDYFDLLDSIPSADASRSQVIELAKRYAYLLFERYQLPFPFLKEVAPHDVRAFAEFSIEEIVAHPTMQLIVGAIENRSEFLIPNEAP